MVGVSALDNNLSLSVLVPKAWMMNFRWGQLETFFQCLEVGENNEDSVDPNAGKDDQEHLDDVENDKNH